MPHPCVTVYGYDAGVKTCEVCKQEILPEHAAAQKVIAWVLVKNGKVTSTSVSSISETLGWAHKVCLESRSVEPQPSLF